MGKKVHLWTFNFANMMQRDFLTGFKGGVYVIQLYRYSFYECSNITAFEMGQFGFLSLFCW